MKNLIQYTLLIAILSVIFSISTLQAQCNAYNYYLDVSGFTCDNKGKIGVLTKVDWQSPWPQCEDYVAEFHFPTNAFIPTSFSVGGLGQMSITYQDPTLTIVQYQGSGIADVLQTATMEGELLIPNTNFRFVIVNKYNSSDIVDTQIFTVDDVISIGQVGQETLLSQAIADDLLLPNNLSSFTAQRVLINGTLSIDESYGFGAVFGNLMNEIVLAEDAKIEIQNNVTLATSRTNIHGCEEKWDRIDVLTGGTFLPSATSISGARVGIEQRDGSTVAFFATKLFDNTIGIGAFGEDMKNISFTVFISFLEASVIFDSYEGMHFENVEIIDIGNSSSNFLFFDNIEKTGIHLENTNLLGAGLYFTDCHEGIYVQDLSNLLSISNSHFENGTRGIRSLGNLEMEVLNSTFTNFTNGIARGSSVINEHSLIEDNFMDACKTNILGVIMSSTALVKNNDLTGRFTNILLLGYGKRKHRWDIQNNSLVASFGFEDEDPVINKTHNIYFLNINNARIFHNIDVFTQEGHNVYISGGKKNIIGYNTFTSDEVGVSIAGSPRTSIVCNDVDAPVGLKILNNCSGSDIRGNLFSGNDFNLLYGSEDNTYAVSSSQEYKGNRFDLSSPSNPKAKHFGNAFLTMSSLYTLGNLAITQGDEYYPYFEAGFDFWFDKFDNIDDYQCPPVFIADENSPLYKIRLAKNTNQTLLDNDIESVYGKEVVFDTNLKLAKNLNALAKYETLSTENDAKLGQLLTKSAGQFAFFKEEFSAAMETSVADEAAIELLNLAIENLTAQIRAIEWYTVDESTLAIEIDETQQAIRDNLKNDLQQKLSDLALIIQNNQADLLASIPNLELLNASITEIETNSGDNLQIINALLLKRIRTSAGLFSSKEIAIIREIANLCIGIGGEAVYTARVLLAETTFTLPVYDDECLVDADKSKKVNLITNNEKTFSIAPNPAKDYTLVTLSSDFGKDKLIIKNILGIIVQIIPVEKGQKQVHISTHSLAQGTYWLSTLAKIVPAKKMIIVK